MVNVIFFDTKKVNYMNKVIFGILIAISLITLSFYAYNYHYKPKKEPADIIKAIMDYKMPHVIARCQKDYNYTDEDMVILEQELKKYLALSAVKAKDELGTGMFSSHVDNLWHSFILFTKEYEEFCNNYIGYFVHHMPEIDKENRSLEKRKESLKDFEAFIKNYEETFHEEIHPIWILDMC